MPAIDRNAPPIPCIEEGCGAQLRLKSGKFGEYFGCERWPFCHGAHSSDQKGNPLGLPADEETRDARVRAHQAHARVIGIVGKGQGYRWLATVLKLDPKDCHMALFDKATCERVIGAVSSYLDHGSRK